MPSARNARAVAAARISQRCIRMASPRGVGRGSAEFRRPSNGKHEGSRIVHPKIPDLAAAVRRLSAARRTRPHVSRSERTPSPGQACAARRKGPSHADGEMALRCRPRTPPIPQLGTEAAPVHIIVCEDGTEWLRRGETAAYLPDSDGHPMATPRVKDRQSDDPGPCCRCTAALSIAADAPAHISLGSHARSGPPMRRSPRRAVPCGHRNGASLSATDASNPAAWRRGSTHPDHSMRGWNRVPLRATIESRTGGAYSDAARAPAESHASVHRVKPDLASATSGSRRLRSFVLVGRSRIARQAWAAHRWAIGTRVLRSTNVNGMCVGPC